MESTPISDQPRDMDERSWWDFWNVSYRAQDDCDTTSGELFAHVVGLLHQVSPQVGRMLEVACGTGTLSRQLEFSSYHGLDISPAAIEIARQKADVLRLPRGTNRPTYEAADFHDWPLPPEPFDVVMCVDAVSCFRDQAYVLRKMARSQPFGLQPDSTSWGSAPGEWPGEPLAFAAGIARTGSAGGAHPGALLHHYAERELGDFASHKCSAARSCAWSTWRRGLQKTERICRPRPIPSRCGKEEHGAEVEKGPGSGFSRPFESWASDIHCRA
jgi:SAM-dependent methyltransferase